MTQESSSSDENASPAGRRLEINNLIIVALGTLGFGLTKDLRMVTSFLAGGLVTVANLWLLRRIITGLLGENRPAKWKLALQILLKFAGMLGIIGALMVWGKPLPIPFLLGLSTLVLTIVFEGLLGLRNQ